MQGYPQHGRSTPEKRLKQPLQWQNWRRQNCSTRKRLMEYGDEFVAECGYNLTDHSFEHVEK